MRKILVVGAGFSGATLARELAEAGYIVDIIDQRHHIAGNSYDEVNELGIRIHKYGPHLFHTNNLDVVSWISRFTDWIPYQHRVMAQLSDGTLTPIPVNEDTLKIVSKDKVIDTFFRPYTKKMWGKEIEELDPQILSRVPIREDKNDLYFPNDRFQALPSNGYTQLVQNMLNHPGITISLNTKYSKALDSGFEHIFNSMAIDEYFDYCLGDLSYRSIKFHTVTLPSPRIFPVAVVNFTHASPYTRITEWKNLPGHGVNDSFTTLTYEEPCDYRENNFERYYPVKDSEGRNKQLYQKYAKLIPPNTTFIGRCGQYVYIDMHQAVASALAAAHKFLNRAKH